MINSENRINGLRQGGIAVALILASIITGHIFPEIPVWTQGLEGGLGVLAAIASLNNLTQGN